MIGLMVTYFTRSHLNEFPRPTGLEMPGQKAQMIEVLMQVTRNTNY